MPDTSCRSEVPTSRSSGSIHLLEGLTELRETLRLTTRIKDAGEQLSEVCEGPKYRSFCLRGGGVSHHMGVGVFPGWKLSQACTIDTSCPCLQRAWSIINSHFQFLSWLWRAGVGAETSKLLIMAWTFWGPAPIVEPTESHLIRTNALT